MRCLILFLFFLVTRTVTAQDNEILKIEVTNIQDIPQCGIYIIKLPENFLLNITDENGKCEINLANYKPTNKLVFYSMGFVPDTLTIEEIQKPLLYVRLHEKMIQLKEVSITKKQITIAQLIKKASDQIEKGQYGGKHWEPRFFGKGVYSKLTECKDKPIQIRRETGIFITSGNTRKEVNGQDWDMAYHLYFMPEFVARSFDFTNDGKDTLKQKYIHFLNERGEKLNYDVACSPKIYNTMRAVYLFAPLFAKPKFFNYHLIDETDQTYVISFSTKTEYYPNKIKVLSRGTFEMDKNNLHLKRMEIEYFADERFQFKLNKTSTNPYQKKLNIEFAYTAGNECYIQNCSLYVIWLYESNQNQQIASREGCPRPYAARDQLIEKENWSCNEYVPFPKTKWQDKEREYILTMIHRISEGKYEKKIFSNLPMTNEFRQAEQLLGKFKDIETQYKKNCNKLYYPNSTLYSQGTWIQIKKIKDSLIKNLNQQWNNEK